MGTVYYCPFHSSDTILLGALKCFVWFHRVTSEPSQYYYFVDLKRQSWRYEYLKQNNLEYLYIEFVKVDPHKRKYVVLKIVCGPSKQTLPQLFYQNLVCVSIARIQRL